MKNNAKTITAVLLVISIGTYFRLVSDGTIRLVEFLSIFSIGVLTGILLVQFLRK
ncbi:MAG: hypothetical protein JNK41_01645 [Saprospiraceae bacterium]|jgi:hypothetical protein|nr:hypothetical protein [Saprospiraceae bacterium]